MEYCYLPYVIIKSNTMNVVMLTSETRNVSTESCRGEAAWLPPQTHSLPAKQGRSKVLLILLTVPVSLTGIGTKYGGYPATEKAFYPVAIIRAVG